MKCETVFLGDIAEMKYGKMPNKAKIGAGQYRVFSGYQYLGCYPEKNVDQNSLVVVARGVGGTGDVKWVDDDCFLTNLSISLKIGDPTISRYLYHKFQVHNLRWLASGSAQPQITISDLEKVEVKIPSKDIRARIVSVADAFETKIKINHRINDYLEEMGQSLLSHYYDACSSNSELNCIMSLGSGFAFKSNTYTDDGLYKVLTIKNVQDGSVDCSASNRIDEIPSKMKDHCRLKLGDVVLSLTGNVGRVGIVAEDNCLLNQRVAVLQPKDPDLLAAIYFVFRDKAFQNEMIGIARGTAQANLSPVETLQLSVPYDEAGLSRLSNALVPVFDLILRNKVESLKLSKLRDALLSKLMSGEIDVSKINLT